MRGSKYKENPAIGAEHSQSSGLNLHINAATGARVSVSVISNVTAKNLSVVANDAGASYYGGDVDVTSVITEHKKSLVSEYKCIREYTSRPGEQVLLEGRYVDPLIIQRHRVKKEKEEEIRSRGNDFYNTRTYNTDQHITVDQLFSQEDRPDGLRPKAVILQGNSVNGKSITAQKIVYDWANGNLFAGVFDIVFHLRCSELNDIAGDVSLVDLLNCTEEMAQILKSESQRVLFLVDGFDELRLSLPKKPLPIKVDIKAQPGVVLSSLLRGCMLNKSYLLITTRSTAAGKLGKLLKSPQRFTEIMGFSENEIREYFQKFFEYDERSGPAYDQVKANGTLYTVCSSPVMCWLICNVYKENHKMSNRMRSDFRSTTSVFVDFVFILLEHHCQGLTESHQLDLLKGLSQLAHEGILKGRVLFQRSEVPEMILDVLDSTSIPFLCAFHHTDRINTKEMFSFMHLSFQEFFAALLYTFLDEKEAKPKLEQLLSFSLHGDYHCLPIVQFLFGLSNKAVSKLLMEKHQLTVSRATYAQLTEWLYKLVSDTSRHSSSSAFQYLYEVNDKYVVRRTMKIWEKIYSCWPVELNFLYTTDYHAAAYCLQFCQPIRSLRLHSCTMENLMILQTALSKCDELRLSVSHVSDTDVTDLISAVGKGKQLKFLSVEDGALSDQSVRRILSTLHKHRSVGSVHLSVKTINYTNAEILMNTFQQNVVPEHLRLSVPTKCRNSEENLCLSLEMSYACSSVSVEHKILDYSDEHIDSGKSEQAFKTISFSSYDFSVDSAFDWRKFLQISSNLKQIENPELHEHVDALVSFFHHIPKLVVSLEAENLSQKCAAKILSFCHAKPVYEESIRFKVERLKGRDEEDVCSLSLSDHYAPYFGTILQLDLKPHEESPQNAESSPVRQEISLSFPFMEEAHVDWNVLLRKLCQTCKSPERYPLLSVLLSVPGLMEVVLSLRSLHEDWAVRILSFLQACTSVLYLEVDVDNRSEYLGMVRGDALSDSVYSGKVVLFLGCSHLKYPFDDRIDESIGIMPVNKRIHKVLPCITLIMANNTEIYNIDWRQFFHFYHQLKGLTEHCLQYDQFLDLLLSVVNSIPGLEEINLALRFLTVDGAFSIVQLMQTCPSLCKIHVTVPSQPKRDFTNSSFPLDRDWDRDSETSSVSSYHSDCSFPLDKDSDSESSSFYSDHSDFRYENDSDGNTNRDNASFQTHSSVPVEIENYDLDLCSELKVRKNAANEFKLSLRCNSSDADTKAVLAYISLILTEHTEESEIDWRSFFQVYYDTKGLTESCSDFAGKLKEVLGFLHWVPGLKKVDLGIHSLTETWASYIFNLCYSNWCIDDICLLLEKEDDSDSACSSVSVKRNPRDSTVTVKIQRVKYTKTWPSVISFTVPHSELLNINGCEVLYRMRCLKYLKDKSYEYNEEINTLMRFLCDIPGLQKLKLEIGNLTQSWVSRILSFSTCTSLYKICVTASYGHLLMEDSVLTIQKKWRRHDCTVVLKGLRCSNSTVRCTEKNWTPHSYTQCNNMVKLSLCGGFCSELNGYYKTDSESGEDCEREDSEREGSEREGSEREGSEREDSEREDSEREDSEREDSESDHYNYRSTSV